MRLITDIPKEKIDELLASKIKELEKNNAKLTKRLSTLEREIAAFRDKRKILDEMYDRFVACCNDYTDNYG